MLFTTLILCGGFLMFLPSKMVSIALFGGLVAFTVFMALVADFVIMPAILEMTRPLGPENNTDSPDSRSVVIPTASNSEASLPSQAKTIVR